jgi:hypothetical protein
MKWNTSMGLIRSDKTWFPFLKSLFSELRANLVDCNNDTVYITCKNHILAPYISVRGDWISFDFRSRGHGSRSQLESDFWFCELMNNVWV